MNGEIAEVLISAQRFIRPAGPDKLVSYQGGAPFAEGYGNAEKKGVRHIMWRKKTGQIN